MGDLEQDAHAVTGLAGSVLTGPVLQLFHDFQGIVHRRHGILRPLMSTTAADTAGIMLKLRIIQPLLGAAFRSEFFHNVSPFRRKNAPMVRDSAGHGFPVP